MYNSKFILVDNMKDIYPAYLTSQTKTYLRDKYMGKKEWLRCGCDLTQPLFYNISSDLKMYPEHNSYQHKPYCCRYKGEKRKSAYSFSDQEEQMVAYLDFDYSKFTIPSEKNDKKKEEKEEEKTLTADETAEYFSNNERESKSSEKKNGEPKPEKEPFLNLTSLIRCINMDVVNYYLWNQQKLTIKEIVARDMYYRTKKVRVSGTKKNIGELTIQSDGVRFMYSELGKINDQTINGKRTVTLSSFSKDGQEFKFFTFAPIYDKAVKEYIKNFGSEPDFDNCYIGGFQYLKKSKAGSNYKVVGRFSFIKTTAHGIVCRNSAELDIYTELEKLCFNNSEYTFFLNPEDDNVCAIVRKKTSPKKLVFVYKEVEDAGDDYIYKKVTAKTDIPDVISSVL